jgi:hypothetical protein
MAKVYYKMFSNKMEHHNEGSENDQEDDEEKYMLLSKSFKKLNSAMERPEEDDGNSILRFIMKAKDVGYSLRLLQSIRRP